MELLEDQSWRASDRTEALTRRTYALFGQYQELVGNLSDQLVASVLDIRDPGLLADTIAANINLRHQDRQRVLQELHPARRLLVMNEILVHEVDIAVLESDIDQKVRQRVGQVQRDMVLRSSCTFCSTSWARTATTSCTNTRRRSTAAGPVTRCGRSS